MAYRINASGELWSSGVFCVPKTVAEKSLKFASESQLKALLYLLSNDGIAEPQEVAKALGISESEAAECLDFWRFEGVLTLDGAVEKKPEKTEEKPPVKPVLENLPVPSLTPRDIVSICSDNPELADLLRTAEIILGTSLSAAFKGNLINMVTYYGLTPSVVVTLLDYYKAEREAGRSVTTRKLQNIAKDWANQDVTTIEQASQKLLEMSEAENLWYKILELCELDFIKLNAANTKMIIRWRNDFSDEMLYFACNTMKKYTDEEKRSIKAVDNILKTWKRKGFTTPEEVKAQPEKEDKTVKKGNLKSKPTFDINEIQKQTDLNDDFDI